MRAYPNTNHIRSIKFTSDKNNNKMERMNGGVRDREKTMRGLKIGTVQNTQSAMGVLITLDEPTQPMKIAAMEAGYYESPTWGHKYPKIQISTITELLQKKKPMIPTH
jgi:hypothetical protein